MFYKEFTFRNRYNNYYIIRKRWFSASRRVQFNVPSALKITTWNIPMGPRRCNLSPLSPSPKYDWLWGPRSAHHRDLKPRFWAVKFGYCIKTLRLTARTGSPHNYTNQKYRNGISIMYIIYSPTQPRLIFVYNTMGTTRHTTRFYIKQFVTQVSWFYCDKREKNNS